MNPPLALLLAGILSSAGLSAEPSLAWPRFRGPNGSGVAEEQRPPVEVGPERHVKWKAAVPPGLSSPIVAGEHVVLTAYEGGKLFTIAHRLTDGREAWRAEAPATKLEAFHKTEGSPAASTPATDGRRIVSYFGSCGLFAYDLAGKEEWRFALPTAATAGDFGTGTSPILADGAVLLVRDEPKEARILAIEAATGVLRWERKRLSPASYSTPVVWETSDGPQVVVAGHVRLVGYDPKTGTEKWSVAGTASGCCTSPVTADGQLFCASGSGGGPDDQEMQMPPYDGLLKDLDADRDGTLSRAEAEKAFEGFFDNQDLNKDGQISRDEWEALARFMSEGKNCAFALKPGGTGDVTRSHVVWMKTKGLPYIASALAYRGQYVMVKDGGIVTAYDLQTGAEVYQERVAAAGRYYASPVAANGHIYLTTLENGTITVLKAGVAAPEVVAMNPKLGERTAATPAIAHDTLFVRTERHLFAFAH